MQSRFVSHAFAGFGALVLGSAVLMGQATWASAAPKPSKSGPIYVSTSGAPDKAGTSCKTAKYNSINAGVAAAPSHGTVIVCKGTYHEDVQVQKALTLTGQDATIDATGLENAVWVVASHVWVGGFTLRNANGEGVLVGVDSFADGSLLPPQSPILSDVTIQDNNVINDNKGFNGTEQSNCKYPGDCGGGIHFNVVRHSAILDNKVVGNADGILLTDDYGPNSHNLIQGNIVDDNKTECGITLPSHSSTAVNYDPNTFAVGSRNPSQGGVFDNVVRLNVADRNGTAPAPPQFGGIGGSGAGIGIFASGPGSAAYDNVVKDNEASGNGLAGVTLHAHHPGGEDMNGNQIVDNALGTNNVAGDAFDGDPMDLQTTAISVFSVPAVQMTIAGNHIHQDHFGIWLSPTVTASGLNSNGFSGVAVPVYHSPS